MSAPGSVLVTGGAGYIGSHVVLALRAAGWPIVVLDDLSTGRLRPLHRDCALVVGDVGDRALVASVLRRYDVVAVVHLAASIVAPASLRHPLPYYENNLAASVGLVEACVRHGVAAFVLSSTAAVYGIPPASPVGEDAPTNPINPYGASKLMVERLLRDAAAAHDLPFSILRYFNVAGADPAGRTGQTETGPAHLLRVALDVACGARAEVPIYGTDHPTVDGTAVRDFVHVSDLAEAHRAALDHLLAGGASCVLNCGYGRGFSVRQVIAAVERVSGRPIPTRPAPRRPGDPSEVVAEASRIRELLGWRPRYDDLDLIVAHALAWRRRSAAGAGAA